VDGNTVLLFLLLHIGITAHLFVVMVISSIIARYRYKIKIHYVSSYYSVLVVSNSSTMLVIQMSITKTLSFSVYRTNGNIICKILVKN
jgi:hypothetical protein